MNQPTNMPYRAKIVECACSAMRRRWSAVKGSILTGAGAHRKSSRNESRKMSSGRRYPAAAKRAKMACQSMLSGGFANQSSGFQPIAHRDAAAGMAEVPDLAMPDKVHQLVLNRRQACATMTDATGRDPPMISAACRSATCFGVENSSR